MTKLGQKAPCSRPIAHTSTANSAKGDSLEVKIKSEEGAEEEGRKKGSQDGDEFFNSLNSDKSFPAPSASPAPSRVSSSPSPSPSAGSDGSDGSDGSEYKDNASVKLEDREEDMVELNNYSDLEDDLTSVVGKKRKATPTKANGNPNKKRISSTSSSPVRSISKAHAGTPAKPTPIKQESTSRYESDTKPKIKADSTRASAANTPRKTKSKDGKNAPRTWSSEEDWVLFTQLHPKVSKPDWGNCALIVGNERDSKSCQNRYAVISKRLEGAIKSISGV